MGVEAENNRIGILSAMNGLIANITESVFGSRYTNLEPIVGQGKNNRVFKVEVNDTTHILRLSNSPKQLIRYEKERWCAKTVIERGIKTPKITHVGSVADWSYSFQEYVCGIQGTQADEEEVWRKLGQVAKAFHQIPASEIGLRYTDKIEGLFEGDFFVKKGILSSELSRKIKARLSETFSWEFAPMLCHGNLHPSNVILDNDGQLWLVDWETASGNNVPQADLAEIYTWNNGKENIATFCEGYGLSGNDVHKMMRGIQTLVLLRLVEVIHGMINGNGGLVDPKNQFIKNTSEKLARIQDYQADILFTKNI